MDDYDRLEQAERKPRRVVDHTARWDLLEPVEHVNGDVGAALERFCERKRISVGSLSALGCRVKVLAGGKIELAFAGTNATGKVTAIKYRPLDGTSHDSRAESPSVPVTGRCIISMKSIRLINSIS